jgi:hypothetical protein
VGVCHRGPPSRLGGLPERVTSHAPVEDPHLKFNGPRDNLDGGLPA